MDNQINTCGEIISGKYDLNAETDCGYSYISEKCGSQGLQCSKCQELDKYGLKMLFCGKNEALNFCVNNKKKFFQSSKCKKKDLDAIKAKKNQQ